MNNLALEFFPSFPSHLSFPCIILPYRTAYVCQNSPWCFKAVIFFHAVSSTWNVSFEIQPFKISTYYCWKFRGLTLPLCSVFSSIMFYSLLYSKCLAKCIAPTRHKMNACWMGNWIQSTNEKRNELGRGVWI